MTERYGFGLGSLRLLHPLNDDPIELGGKDNMGETVFMIHGMWGGPWYWGKYAGFLQEKGYHCVTTTLRFHDVDPNSPPDPRLGMTSVERQLEVPVNDN